MDAEGQKGPAEKAPARVILSATAALSRSCPSRGHVLAGCDGVELSRLARWMHERVEEWLFSAA
jgi:hypothetical protein